MAVVVLRLGDHAACRASAAAPGCAAPSRRCGCCTGSYMLGEAIIPASRAASCGRRHASRASGSGCLRRDRRRVAHAVSGPSRSLAVPPK